MPDTYVVESGDVNEPDMMRVIADRMAISPGALLAYNADGKPIAGFRHWIRYYRDVVA